MSGNDQAVIWLGAFADGLRHRDAAAVAALFAADGHWRDLLSFTWSIVTSSGPAEIERMLLQCADADARGFALEGPGEIAADGTVEAWFRFETASAVCRGLLRLRGGLCWTLFTCMSDLKGHPEPLGPLRERGVEEALSAGQSNWTERRRQAAEAIGRTRQPYCLIIGGGQGGIALAARLKMRGVPTLVVDSHARAGDAWRARYDALCLHDPVWNIHLPYVPFPEHWPVFTPKDRMADWLEAYVDLMELDYWPSSEAVSARYDEQAREWRVVIRRAGEDLTLTPNQLVIATGMSGAPHIPRYPGAEDFAGEQMHSSEYRSGKAFAGKRCVVVGSNNSAHDICADLWQHGAEVTMLQRSATTVVRVASVTRFISSKLYSEAALAAGITTERADFIHASRPYAVATEMHKVICRDIREHDAAFYARLAATGFMLDFGEDESGHSIKYLRRGSGYYIDVGASELIIDGRVALKAGARIEGLTRNGIVLAGSGDLQTDLIVYATGFDAMERWIEKLISPEVARRVGHIWGLGSDTAKDPGPWEGELRNMWKPTAQEGLWIHGGNLHQSRFYSKLLALQIKARWEGIETPVYDPKREPSHSAAAHRAGSPCR